MRDAGLAKIDAVRHGLRIALEAMSAVEEDGPATLPSLETPQPLSDKQQIDARPAQNSAKSLSKNFVTFRDLVERTISAAGGWMQALGRSHPTSGKALFKVSASAGVSSGVLVYLDEGVLFFEDPEQGGQWRPIGLEDVLQKIRSK